MSKDRPADRRPPPTRAPGAGESPAEESLGRALLWVVLFVFTVGFIPIGYLLARALGL